MKLKVLILLFIFITTFSICLYAIYTKPQETTEQTEEPLTLPGMIKEVINRISEKLPEATRILVPLIVAIVLIGIVIYVFVI